MRYFPAFLDLRDRRCVVVGGGAIAARKVELLTRAGARVTVVAPKIGDAIATAAAAGRITVVRRGFVAGDVSGAAVVHGATGIAAVDERVFEAATAAGVPVNVVDKPELSSFVVPAIIDRDPIVVGVCSSGAAPVLARRLRQKIEALLPAKLGRLAGFAEGFRSAVRATIPDALARLRFWERFFDGPIAGAILAGDERGSRERMLALINGRTARASRGGIVHIVGAGPGDPDLLTLRALRLLAEADIIVHDNLVGAEILDLARRDARRLFVGKAKGRHSATQDEINALLAAEAEAGHRVVRLKGGDPFVFGRGGEEVAYLRQRGIPVSLVPGITAATGCAAATGIPLTHRAHASAVTLVTGHSSDGGGEPNWAALAQLKQTLAIYMGLGRAGEIAAKLIAHGLAADTPAAVIENGTRSNQRLLLGRLDGVADIIRDHGVRGPALIVIGDVVSLAEAATLTAFAPPARAVAG